MKKVLMAVAVSISGLFSFLSADNTTHKSVAVLPLEAINISVSDADLMSREISDGFTSVPDIQLISFDKVLGNFKKTDINKDSTCRNRVCLLNVGKSLYADIVFIGSFYKIDNKLTLAIAAVNCKDNSTLWTKDYSCECEINEFVKKTSYTVVYDARNVLFKSGESENVQVSAKKNEVVSESIKKEEPISIRETPVAEQTTIIVENDESDDDEEEEDEEEDDDDNVSRDFGNGTVTGFTLGMNFRYIVDGYEDKAGESESELGAEVFALFPTSKRSHVRCRVSLPMSTSGDFLENSTYKEDRDYLFSLDHEWGFKNVGLTIGAAYMYFRDFKRINEDNGRLYNYESHSRLNWVMGIRGGKPNRGFRGRISYPMTFSEDEILFIDYSAFGMFGNNRVKAGIGMQGSVKTRTSEDRDTSSYYSYSTDTDEVEEYYFAAPCVKIAFLAGSHSVISLGIDFMGLIIPDVFDEDKDWTPNVFLGYTFSIGSIKTVETFDGRF